MGTLGRNLPLNATLLGVFDFTSRAAADLEVVLALSRSSAGFCSQVVKVLVQEIVRALGNTINQLAMFSSYFTKVWKEREWKKFRANSGG